MYSTVARANLTGKILLDGVAVSGGTFQYTFYENTDNSKNFSGKNNLSIFLNH